MSLLISRESVNPQINSKFIQAPYDIRREIFHHLTPEGLHVIQHEGKLDLSECFGCPPADAIFPDQERLEGLPVGDKNKHVRDKQHARRLTSSWGRHWRCEELVLGRKGDGSGK